MANYEKETILVYTEGEDTASVYTYNKALRRKLDKLSADCPEEYRLYRLSHDGLAAEFYLPKSWIKISPPRVPTQAQRATALAGLQKARSMR